MNKIVPISALQSSLSSRGSDKHWLLTSALCSILFRLHMQFVVRTLTLEQILLPVSSVFPYQSPLYHCSILMYNHAISLTTQHIIVSSVPTLGRHLWQQF